MTNETPERILTEMSDEEILHYIEELRAQRNKRSVEAAEKKQRAVKEAKKEKSVKENDLSGAELDMMRAILAGEENESN